MQLGDEYKCVRVSKKFLCICLRAKDTMNGCTVLKLLSREGTQVSTRATFFPETPSTSMSVIIIMKLFISSQCNGAQRLFARLYKAYANLQQTSQFSTIHENVKEILNHNILNLNT